MYLLQYSLIFFIYLPKINYSLIILYSIVLVTIRGFLVIVFVAKFLGKPLAYNKNLVNLESKNDGDNRLNAIGCYISLIFR